jgi:hypothetical protein
MQHQLSYAALLYQRKQLNKWLRQSAKILATLDKEN